MKERKKEIKINKEKTKEKALRKFQISTNNKELLPISKIKVKELSKPLIINVNDLLKLRQESIKEEIKRWLVYRKHVISIAVKETQPQRIKRERKVLNVPLADSDIQLFKNISMRYIVFQYIHPNLVDFFENDTVVKLDEESDYN